MKTNYLLIGIRFNILYKLIKRNKICFNPKYLSRLSLLLFNSILSSLLSVWENKKYGTAIKKAPLPPDPVIIIGHWRSGTTYLHQLLDCHPELTAPTMLQCCYPEGFLTGGKFLEPLMNLFINSTRPFDNIRIGSKEPQEDEFALLRMTAESPLEHLIFPSNLHYFLDEIYSLLQEDNLSKSWEEALKILCKKIYLKINKRIVLKNPFHSVRIKRLLTIFPECQFIHIYRDPKKVIPSTLKTWKKVYIQNSLNTNGQLFHLSDLINIYDNILWSIRKNLSQLKPHQYYNVKYESLEKDPIKTIRACLNHLKIDFNHEVQNNIASFLKANRNYKKNIYSLTPEKENLIQLRLKHHLDYFQYI